MHTKYSKSNFGAYITRKIAYKAIFLAEYHKAELLRFLATEKLKTELLRFVQAAHNFASLQTDCFITCPRHLSETFPLYYTNFTAVPYAITSAAPCIMAEEA